MRNITQKQTVFVFLIVLFLLQLVFLFLNTQYFGGADNFTHFQISRYAFQYPQLFLDLWGKPFYTTLSAPFAQPGIKGAQLFNIIIGTISLYLTFLTSKQFFKKGALFSVILVAFSPLYFILFPTCLTEILFSFVLILSVYLFLKNRFILSAIILSFIPFVRTEGYILIPVFTLALILNRRYKTIPFLFFGTVIYSIIGYFALNDFFWLVNKFPYPTGESVYGSGNLWHFVEKSHYIFGIPMLLLLVFSMFVWIARIINNFSLRNQSVIYFILIAGSFLGYFSAHSYVWWKGMGGSLGLIRVIGAVIPIAGVICIFGIKYLYEKFANKFILNVVFSVLIVAQVYSVFSYHKLPLKADAITFLIKDASEYLKEKKSTNKIYYFNPQFAFYIKLNPYDQSKSNWGVGDKLKPSNSMNFGDILVWDAHFGPNEGSVSLKTLENDGHLQKIKSFLPLQKITVLGGYDYAIHIFKKVKNQQEKNTNSLFVRSLNISPEVTDRAYTIDGDTVIDILPNDLYSPNIAIYAEELNRKEIFEAEVELQFKSGTVISEKEALLVFSIENGKENLHYNTTQLTWSNEEKGWKTLTLQSRFPANLPESSVIKIYVWNRNGKHIQLKHLETRISSY